MHVKMFLQRSQVNDIMFLQGIPECMMMPIQHIGCNNNSTINTSTSKPHCDASVPMRSKRDYSWHEDTETDNIFMSKEEIERCSPSRKNGIDAMHETHLRYSYCAFLQNLGIHLDLPHTSYRNCHGSMSPLLYVAIIFYCYCFSLSCGEVGRDCTTSQQCSEGFM